MPLWFTCWHLEYLPEAGERVQGYGDTDRDLEELVPLQLRCLFYLVMMGWEGVGLGSSTIQFFIVWIAMQFLHACRLSLFL